MTASAAGITGFVAFLFVSEDEFRLIDKFRKNVSYRQCEGDKD